MKHCLLLLLVAATLSQRLTNRWAIQPNQANVWQQYGLNMTSGFSTSALKNQNHNVEINLYQDDTYQTYLFVKVFLNYSINSDYPFYDGLAHIEYQLHAPKEQYPLVQDETIMPYIYFSNHSISITQDNSTITVDFKEEKMSPLIVVISVAHLALKCALLFQMITAFRRDNTRLSFAFVYVIIGFELQAHIFVMKVFQASFDQDMYSVGLMIGFAGWTSTLLSLLYLPRPLNFCQSIEGLAYYMYQCMNGFLLGQSGNMILYALSPVLQVRFNLVRNRKDSVCPFATAIYFINIFFFYYFKGCPACILRFPIELDACIKATLIGIVLVVVLCMQQKYGSLLCARELVNGKDYKYLQQICLSEGEDMVEDVCSICLQPLTTEMLLENVREQNGRRFGQLMRTPCNHRYHPSCLRKWMTQRATCPLDNQHIPPCYE